MENKYITEFPVLDHNIKDLNIQCNRYYIGEECTYFDDLPPDLDSLKVTSDAQIEYRFSNLPFQLKCLYIKCTEMKYPIEPLPVNLTCFKLDCDKYNFPIELPPNIRHFENYCDDYSYGAENVPDSVVALGISYKSIKTLDKVPKNCKILGYVGCPDELYNDLIKRKLKIMIVKKNFVVQMCNSNIHNCCLCIGF